jgi:hypothetical protein
MQQLGPVPLSPRGILPGPEEGKSINLLLFLQKQNLSLESERERESLLGTITHDAMTGAKWRLDSPKKRNRLTKNWS